MSITFWDIYSRPPRNPRENIFNSRIIADIFIKGAVLFIAVTSAYFYARSQNQGIVYAQTFAFSAWIFAHILLAFISRSDKESVLSMGFFRNKIIDLWAVGAIGFLVLGIYVPGLTERINLVSIKLGQLISIAVAVSLIIGTLELKKIFNLNRNIGNA